MDKRKYALLDTDFIFKGFYVKKDEAAHLIDHVPELPGYQFFCHSQIVTELSRHNSDASAWLDKKISEQKVLNFTDAQILTYFRLRLLGLSGIVMTSFPESKSGFKYAFRK